MRITMLLADFANLEQTGKLNVLGIFDEVHAVQFPVRQHSMVLVIRIALDIGEKPTKRDFAVRLLDDDGVEQLELHGQIEFHHEPDKGLPQVNIITALQNVVFPVPGRYEFRLFLNEETKDSLPLQVIQLQKPEQA